VHTCGICEVIVEETSIPTHGCMEAYTQLFIDENFYFYPVTENRSLNKRDQRATRSTLNYDDEKLLILSVQERRPLWDFTIPLEQRCQRVIKKLWDEVSEAMGAWWNREEAKKKFKHLHDAYRRIINSENHPSGSARPPPTKKWHHYDSMEFLRNLCLVRQLIEERGRQFSALDRIADSLCQPQTPFALPAAPKLNHIELALGIIGHRLQQMDPKTQLHIIQQIMNLTYDVLKED
ncbi:hypothetical protein ALC62_07156, partial [Cyphomyrmex costatus]